MEQREIEELKFEITKLVREEKKIRIPQFDISGKIVGIGFRPYWTGIYDTKIDKLELSIRNERGRIIPFTFNYIIGYDKSYEDSKREDNKNKQFFDIHVFSILRASDKKPYDKIRIEFEE